jgi:hypothetical protein
VQKVVGSNPAAADSLMQLAAHSTAHDDLLTHTVYTNLLLHSNAQRPHEVLLPLTLPCMTCDSTGQVVLVAPRG